MYKPLLFLGFTLIYSAMAGVGGFVGYRVSVIKDRRNHDANAFAAGIAWPLLLPALGVFWWMYSHTREYRQKQLEQAEQQLREAQKEAESLLES